jgi:thiol-disulfide isomerase/thioredoxin
MKKLISTIACLALLTSCSSTSAKKVEATGKIISCTTISTDHITTKGTTVPCLDGGPGIVLEALRGPAVVNVWGSWCAPCVAEMPHFVALAKTGKISIVGVDVEEKSREAGKKFAISHGINWPILYDPDGRTKALYGLGVPVTWYISAKGEVAYRHVGLVKSEKILFDEVRKYLGVDL